jgi:carbonyl reductase 1
VVTGGNRGLGRETCRQLAQTGVHVCLTSRDPDAGRAAAAELRDDGVDPALLHPHPLDVTRDDSAAALAAYVRDTWGGLDILVNNAGASFRGFDADVARNTLAANFFGVVRVTDALLPLMREPSTIVMVSSGMGKLTCLSPERRRLFEDPALDRAGLLALMEAFIADVAAGQHAERGWPTSAYSVSKVGLNALTRVLDRELSARDIAVNAVCPGWVRTDMGGGSAPLSVSEGADTIVWAAVRAPDGPTGQFFRDRQSIDW